MLETLIHQSTLFIMRGGLSMSQHCPFDCQKVCPEKKNRRPLGQGVLDPLDCLAIGTGNCLVLFACTARARLALGTLPDKVTDLGRTWGHLWRHVGS